MFVCLCDRCCIFPKNVNLKWHSSTQNKRRLYSEYFVIFNNFSSYKHDYIHISDISIII